MVANQIAELEYLTYDYLLEGHDRPRQQWLSKYESLLEAMPDTDAPAVDEIAVCDVQADHQNPGGIPAAPCRRLILFAGSDHLRGPLSAL